jgi:hypothetical protein
MVQCEKVDIGESTRFQIDQYWAEVTIEKLTKATMLLQPYGPDAPETLVLCALVGIKSSFQLEAGDRARCIIHNTRFFMAERGSVYSFNPDPNDTRLLQVFIERINEDGGIVHVKITYFAGPR